MSSAGTSPFPSPPEAPSRPWREIELAVLALLVLAIYFARLTDLTIRGEEARWARVAQEMLDTGDWIVPRQQGEPFPDRPPLNSWLMIGASKFTGGMNLAAIRLPAVFATLLVTMAIYLYGRNFLSRLGALAAAAAYPTMVQVLQLGRVGESDALLTLWLSLALFCWHYAYACRRNARLAWLSGYALAALAGLAKGPQGPVYFVAISGVFLAWHKDWRFLCNRWHAAGAALFVAVLAMWQLPFLWELDAGAARAVWAEGGELSERFDYSNFRRVLAHWAGFPFEVFACLMPWSCLLPVVATPWFRRQWGPVRPLVLFALAAWAVALPTCWLPAHSRTRYLMSLYPLAALLAGAVVQRCCEQRAQDWWSRSWDRFLLWGGAAAAVCGVSLSTVSAVGLLDRMNLSTALPKPLVIAYLVVALLLAGMMLWSRGRASLLSAEAGVLALACFMGLTHTGLIVSAQAQNSNDPSQVIAEVRALIPPGERLMSIDKVHHMFAYYFEHPIELQVVGKSRVATEMTGQYFCFAVDPEAKPIEIPFAWETVAEISCERTKTLQPRTKVVVGRRLAYEQVAASSVLKASASAPQLAPQGPHTARLRPQPTLAR